MRVVAILLCAGRGERLGREVPKALVPLGGRPLFAWSLETLEHCAAVDGIVVVGPEKKLKAALETIPAKVLAWVEGGRERQDSVAGALAALPAETGLVAVHDAARALASAALVGRVIADALVHGAAIAAVPLADTVKRATLQSVDATVPRSGLWCAQTPQVFRRDWFEAAHAAVTRTRGAKVHATDDAALVEAIGHPVRLTLGETLNFKITTPSDLDLAEAWLTRTAART